MGNAIKILIGDNDTRMSHLYKRDIPKGVFETVVVDNNLKALEMYEEVRPDIIFLNTALPYMNTLSVVKSIRKRHGDHRTVIMVVTKHEDRHEREDLEYLGIQGYLTSPKVPAMLNAALSRLFGYTGENAKPFRLLIVDDDQRVRDLYGKFLRNKGFRTLLADNGTSAMEAYKEFKPDIIALDITMPGVNGIEVLSHIRTLQGDTRTTVIMATATRAPDMVKKCADLGIQGYLVKPFDLKSLGDKLVNFRLMHLAQQRNK